MIRLALIGCGRHSGRFHAPSLAKYAAQHPGEVELAAACDLDQAAAEQFCRQFGFARAYGDVDRMLADEPLDACWSVMPHDAIVAMGTKLLERKMPCVIEKPIGRTLAEARRLAEVAEKTGTTHMISLNRRFNPYLTRALEWARPRGPVLYVHGRMVRHARREARLIRGVGLHGLDVLMFIGGELAARDTRVVTAPAVTGRWYMIDLAFAGGALGRLELLATAGMKEETYDIYGEDYRCRVSVPIWGSEASVRCWYRNQLELEDVAGPDEPEIITDGAYAEAEHFLGCLREGRGPRPTARDALAATEITFAIAAEAGPPGAVGT